ncbi:MAG: TIGR01777 family oxidoreductase [Anaerolineaceae bacterium]|nr:TIGR01777 family oxidoreductase [Anaerolineaceae bacterium]
MEILITGGTGFIGRFLIPELARGGHHVTVLTRRPPAPSSDGAVDWLAWDAETAAGWGTHLEQTDAIINLAGENIGARRWTAGQKQRILDSRMKAGQAIVEAVERSAHKPAVLLQSSAVGYYGALDERAVNEEAPPGKDYLAQVAVAWEESTRAVETQGVRRIRLRSGLVLARQGGSFPRMLLPFQLFAGGPLGRGNQYWSWIHMLDEVRAIRFLLEHPQAEGAYNLTGPEPVPMRHFGRALARDFHRPYWLPAPAWALQVLLGEMSLLVLEGQRVLPERLLALGFAFHFPSIEEALADLARPN